LRDGLAQVVAGRHQTERVALGKDADESPLFANKHSARVLGSQQLQHFAQGSIGLDEQRFVRVCRGHRFGAKTELKTHG